MERLLDHVYASPAILMVEPDLLFHDTPFSTQYLLSFVFLLLPGSAIQTKNTNSITTHDSFCSPVISFEYRLYCIRVELHTEPFILALIEWREEWMISSYRWLTLQ